MSNYTKTTDFGAKDSLPTGDSGKIIRGTEFETEFDAISTAIATKADIAGPTFTGTLTYETISDGTISITGFVDEDDMSSDSVNLVPTQQSVKAYVDAVTTELQAQDLDFQADTGGALSIDLDSETLTFTGGTGIDTSGSGNAVTFAIDSTVATLTGTQTLTNKTLTSPDVNTPDIDGGTIDGTVIGGTTAAAGSFTTVSATGNITVGGTVDGRDVATDGTKLDGIEAGATADQTAAEIRTLVEAATDSNVFTDADHTKLDGIEANATADQTAAEIRTLVDSATDSNVFTDADHTKLDGIEAGADVTDTTNVTAAGAVMDSELTNETAVKSLNQGVATTDSPTFAGLTTTANVSFGDNDKAIFGAGNDLQIFHDSSDSYIKDEGTGNLYLTTNGSTMNLQAGSDNMVKIYKDAQVEIFHDASVKLATTATGIDVTGTLVSDGLTVDGGTNLLTRTSSGAEVDVLEVRNSATATSTASTIKFVNSTAAGSNSGSSELVAVRTGTNTGDFKIRTSNSTGSMIDRLLVDSGGDISFYEDTGTTAKLFWDASAESLGINDTTPENKLTVVDTDGGSGIAVVKARTPTTNGRASYQIGNDADNWFMGIDGGNSDAFFIADAVGSSDKLVITQGGNVGIGTSSPSSPLEVAGGSSYPTTKFSRDGGSAATQGYLTTGFSAIGYSGGTGADAYLVSEHGFGFAVNASTNALVITDGGNVNIATTSAYSGAKLSVNGSIVQANGTQHVIGTFGSSGLQLIGTAGGDNVVGTMGSSEPLIFRTVSAERMRIDSSGNVGIGTTSPFGRLSVDVAAGAPASSGNMTNGFTVHNSNGGRAIQLGVNETGAYNYLQSSYVNNANVAVNMAFFTGASERMRIDTSGNLLVGTTASAPNGGEGVKIIPAYHGTNKSWTAISTAGYQTETTLSIYSTAVTAYRFYVDAAGTISAVNTTITSLSDERAKENIRDLDDGLAKVMQLQPRKFDWKKGQGKDISNDRGFIAQEFEQVFPDMIEEWKDEAPEGEEPYKAVNANLIPTLVKAIQEQNELINDLRARVAQLEGEN